MSAPKRGAASRLRRLLAMIPWLAENDGPTVEEVQARFGISVQDLRADLELLTLYVGVPPYTPERLFHVTVERGRVFAHLTPALDRPLRLTPEEGIALVVAGRALLDVEGAEPDGPLGRALDKVAGVLGIEPGETLEIDLGLPATPALAVLRAAIDHGVQVEIDHLAAGRDERTVRRVDPWAVLHEGGRWYLVGHDHLRDAQRTFRVDRILAARPTDEPVRTPAPDGVSATFSPSDDDPRIVLELEPAARWVVETVPVESVEVVAGDRIRVRLAVSGRAWLEQLLLRLGPDARVVEGPPELATAGRDAAARLLARYGAAPARG